MGSSSHGCEECIYSWRSQGGDIYGAAIGIHSKLFPRLQIKEIFVWPKTGSQSLVCKDGFFPIFHWIHSMQI